jgi:hypothetical protein
MRNLLNSVYRPIRTVSSKEAVVFWISFASSCVFGQIAILGGISLATEKNISIGDVFLQNLLSANMYTFAIALLVAACTMLVIEYVDSKNTSNTLQLLNHKAAAAVIAGLLIVVQAMTAGHLLRDSLIQTKAAPLSTPAIQSLLDAANVMQLTLWIISMLVAQYLFCLTRMHRYPDEVALMVQAEASELAGDAHNKTTTSDGESI